MIVTKRAVVKTWEHELSLAWRQYHQSRFLGYVSPSDVSYVRYAIAKLRWARNLAEGKLAL